MYVSIYLSLICGLLSILPSPQAGKVISEIKMPRHFADYIYNYAVDDDVRKRPGDPLHHMIQTSLDTLNPNTRRWGFFSILKRIIMKEANEFIDDDIGNLKEDIITDDIGNLKEDVENALGVVLEAGKIFM